MQKDENSSFGPNSRWISRFQQEDEMKIDLTKNTIVCGDNVSWLEDIPDESIDFCYIDPPYFSGEDRDIVWKNGTERRSFGDKFQGDVRYYIEWMRPRIDLIHRKLKKTGTLFLQCDWHASHRLRCLLDEIFKPQNFRNEIVWKRTSAANDSKTFGNQHDTIFFYSKGNKFTFNKQYVDYDKEYLKRFCHTDAKGAFMDTPLTAKGLRGGGYTYSWQGVQGLWKCPIKTMKKYEQEDRIYYTSTGMPRYKKYLHESKGKRLQDVWVDVAGINSQGDENLGYPTQKPERLIKRIIECASNKNDIVLDCFSGGGTTAKVCAEVGRRFIVGDVSPVAVRMTAIRLQKAGITNFVIKNLARTYDQFLNMDGKDFEKFVCDARGWDHSGHKGRDGNIDGWTALKEPIQIKHQQMPTGPKDIKEFFGTLTSRKKSKGYFVAWEFTRSARKQVAEFKQENGIEIELMTCHAALGPLVLTPEDGQEYESIFREMAPPTWSEDPEAELPNAN